MAKPTPPATPTVNPEENVDNTQSDTVANGSADSTVIAAGTDITQQDAEATSAAEENFLDADVTIEDRSFGMLFPLVQFVNGSPANKRLGGIAYTGGFFLSEDQGITLPGFEPYVLTTREGVEVPGYASRTLTGSVVRYRRGFLAVPEKEGALPIRFANSEYDLAMQAGKVRGQTHVLFLPKGSTETVMVSFRGLGSKAVAGMGKERGAIPSFGQKIVGRASQLAKQSGRAKVFPLCAFTMTLGPDVLDDGAPRFTEVGKTAKSMITLPVWLDAPKGQVNQDTIQKLYVGQTVFQKGQLEFENSAAWGEEWSEEALVARRSRRGTKGTDGEAATGEEAPAGGKPGKDQVPF